MTLEEFANQPIGQIIMHPAFVGASIRGSRFSPMMWEIDMAADAIPQGGFVFMGMRTPYPTFKFYQLFNAEAALLLK